MGIHRLPHPQVAVGLLVIDEEGHARFDGLFVSPRLMRLAGAEERQQCQGGSRGFRTPALASPEQLESLHRVL